MENRKILFKSQSRVLSPRNHIQINRERQRVARNINREKSFQSNRNISISPKTSTTVRTREGKMPIRSSGTATNVGQENRLPNQLENEASTSKVSKRHEDYLQRFIKWRATTKRQPSQIKGPKDPQSLSQQISTQTENRQKRQSLYLAVDSKTAVPPMKKHVNDVKTLTTVITKLSAVSKPFSTIPPLSTAIRGKDPHQKKVLLQNPVKEISNMETNDKPKPPATLEGTKTLKSPAKRAQRPLNLRAQPFDVPTIDQKVLITLQEGGAASKFKTAARRGIKKDLSSQLTKRMKAKNAITLGRKKECIIVPKHDLLQPGSNLRTAKKSLNVASNNNLFLAQATSTQCKLNNSSADTGDAYVDIAKISPVRVDLKSSAKRQLLTTDTEQAKCKFNFVRYSEVNTSILSLSVMHSENNVMPPEEVVDEMTVLPGTPPRDAGCQPNYLSPFVTVSRGKVNSQAEREKRNSMYMQIQDGEKPETPIAVRRTLESVKYFRTQLDKEINRLNLLCDEWHLYINQNEAQLQKTGGKDMIDAAIGQTKLLTSKKLMQFKGLIDRCEAGATGIGMRPNDGSESTKPVLVEDLEGWWDMMRLQSDNLDKRFDNLMRWKANDWLDPDATVLPKRKPNLQLKNKKKSTAKASSNIKNFLRKAYADKRKNQASDCLTEANGQSSLTPKRRSLLRTIVVRDHKSLSPARTLLRVPSRSNEGNILLKSAILAAAQEISRKHLTPSTGNRMSILKTPGTKKSETRARNVVFSAKKKIRRFQFTFDEGNLSGEEEALPGVEKLEDCEEDMSAEIRLSQGEKSRTYSLRNRKVFLRPSSEFM